MMAEQPSFPVAERARPRLVEEPSSERAITTRTERDIGTIVADVWENAEKLVRQELELGLAEIDRRVDKLKVGLLQSVIGGAVLYAGVLVLLAAVVLGLSNVMAPWIAALVVGVAATGTGVVLSQRGGHHIEDSATNDEHLQRTMNAAKEVVR